MNVIPKGLAQSLLLLLLDDGKRIVPINLPHHFERVLKAGQTVLVNANPHKDARPSDQPVSWIEEDKGTCFDGVVEQINCALHGEAYGTILKSGEFVHLHPSGARSVKLPPGQALSIEGEATTAVSGQVVIEARSVNGFALREATEIAHRARAHVEEHRDMRKMTAEGKKKSSKKHAAASPSVGLWTCPTTRRCGPSQTP